MARHLSEMMLIVRAQNQASGALRRVGKDLSMLGRHRNLQIQQQKVMLQQQNLMRQRAAATRRLESLTTGKQALALQRRAIDIEKARAALEHKRAGFLQAQRMISVGIMGQQEKMLKAANDIERAETARQRLLSRGKRIVQAENAALAARKAMLRSAGGLKNVSEEADKASKRSIEDVRQARRLLDRDIASNVKKQQEYADASRRANRTIIEQMRNSARLGSALRNTGLDAQKLAVRERELSAAHKYNAQQANEARSQLRSIAQRYAIVNQQQKELSKSIRQARWEPLSTAGRTIQHLGRVGQYATLVLGGGLAYAAHQAAVFESSVTKVATQTGKVDSNFGRTTATIVRNSKQLQKAFINIQMDSTSSMEQITDAGYDLFSTLDQLGESAAGLKRGTGILKLFSDAAIAGGTDISTVGDGVVATLSAFDDMPQTVGSVQKLLNRMFAAVRFGRVTFAEFAATLGTTTPAARAAGQSFDTLAGTIAFLSKPLGIAKASVGFARLTEILSRKKFVDGLKKAGVSITDTNGKMLQMPEVIDRITKKFPELTKGGVKLMQFFKELSGTEGTIQARRAFVFLAQDLAGYRRILKKTTTDNNEMDRSLKTMEATTGVRWQKFMNQLRALALMIGAQVLPEILKLAPHVQRMVDWFTKMDPALRADLVHFLAMGVAILGVTSAIAFLLGPLIRLIALLGKGRLLFLGTIGVLIAISAALGLLTGDWDGLNTIVSDFFGLTEKGKWGWVAFFGIAAVGAYKLAKAITAVRSAYIAAGIAQGAGTAAGMGGMVGFFGKTGKFSSDLKGLKAISKESGRMKALMVGAQLAAAGMGTPLLVAGGAIVAAGAAAYLWKKHMDGVAAKAEQVARAQKQFIAESSRATTQAADFGKTGERIVNAKKLGIELQRQKLILADLTEQYKTATGRQKQMLGLDIQDALIRVGEYTRMYAQAVASANNSGKQLTNTLISQAHNVDMYNQRLQAIKQTEARIATLRAQDRARGGGALGITNAQKIQELQNKLTGLRGGLAALEARAQKTGAVLRTSFQNVIKDLQAGALLPSKISKGAMDAALKLALSKGRMLTVPEIKAVIKAYADKASYKKAAADIKRAVGIVKVDLRINRLQAKKTDLKKQLYTAMHTGDTVDAAKIRVELGETNTALKNSQAARAKINAVFKKAITQNINVKVNPKDTTPIGLAISQGIATGITNGLPAVRTAVDQLIAEANRAAMAKAEIGSPSKLFERTVGIPIIQGIIKGMLDKKPEITKTAYLMIDLFNGAFLQRKNQKIEAIGDNKEFDQLKLDEYLQRQKDALAKFAKSKKQIDKIRADQYGAKAAKMAARKGLSFTDLLKDARGQVEQFVKFNDSIAKLRKKGAPAGLLDDLRALGIDGLKYITLLAEASPAKLKKYIRAWNQMQGQVRRSQVTSIEDLKNWKNQTKEEFDDLVKTAASNLLDKWNEFRSQNVANFGTLFEGPTGLADRVGSAFDDALQTYEDSVKDFNDQIKDLDKELADATADAYKEIGRLNAEAIAEMARLTADALKQRTDELGSMFGELFTGAWMQGAEMQLKGEWGITASFDDLLRDLQGQLTDFNSWRTTLNELSAKVPADMALALEQLGPAAAAQLGVLNSATTEQLAQYIGVWQAKQGAIASVAQATFETPELAAQIQEVKNTLNTEILAINTDLATRATEIGASIAEIRRQLTELVKPLAITGQDVINDLNAQIDGWNVWESALTQLKNRGVPLQIVQQLRELGPQALPYLQALTSLTDQQLITNGDSWVNTWKKGQDLINQSTNTMMNEQLTIWKQYGSDIATAIIAGLATEQDALLQFFSNMFKNMLEGRFPTMPTGAGGGGGGQYGAPDPWMVAAGLAPPSGSEAAPMNTTYNSTSSGATVNQTVIAHQDESLESTLARANFRLGWRAE